MHIKIFGKFDFFAKIWNFTLPYFACENFTKPGILWLGDIRLATGYKGSIEVWSKGQAHWCVHLRPFLALKAIQKLIDFWYVLKYLKSSQIHICPSWSSGLRLQLILLASKASWVRNPRPPKNIFCAFLSLFEHSAIEWKLSTNMKFKKWIVMLFLLDIFF